jgi:hypothetical protein
MVIGGQRYHRVTAQSGSVELVYEAVVDAITRDDPKRGRSQQMKAEEIKRVVKERTAKPPKHMVR